MAAQNLVEATINLIIAKLKADLPVALAEVRNERVDAIVTTEIPASYFNYERVMGYKTPAVVVVPTSIDFRLPNGQNHINSLNTIMVSIILEDRRAEYLSIKSYRYSDAFHKVLDRAHLDDPISDSRNIVKVTRIDFSRTMEGVSKEESPFRKEVMLTCEVEHYEDEN